VPKISLYISSKHGWTFWLDQLAGDRSKVGVFARADDVDPIHPKWYPCTVHAEFDHSLPAWFLTFVYGKKPGTMR